MTDVPELADHFGRRSEETKQESFEQSTLKLVLRQLGASPVLIDQWRSSLQDGFTMQWFNDQGWIQDQVETERVFRYDLGSLLVKPTIKHPVVEMFFRVWRERKSRQSEQLAVVFRCYEYGRLIACSWDPGDTCLRVRVAGMDPFCVAPFNAFFRRYGDVIGASDGEG